MPKAASPASGKALQGITTEQVDCHERVPRMWIFVCPRSSRKAVQIAMAGIYDLRLHHDEVVMPVLRSVKALDATGLGGDGEQARDQLITFLTEFDRAASRFTDRRNTIEAARAARPVGSANPA